MLITPKLAMLMGDATEAPANLASVRLRTLRAKDNQDEYDALARGSEEMAKRMAEQNATTRPGRHGEPATEPAREGEPPAGPAAPSFEDATKAMNAARADFDAHGLLPCLGAAQDLDDVLAGWFSHVPRRSDLPFLFLL